MTITDSVIQQLSGVQAEAERFLLVNDVRSALEQLTFNEHITPQAKTVVRKLFNSIDWLAVFRAGQTKFEQPPAPHTTAPRKYSLAQLERDFDYQPLNRCLTMHYAEYDGGKDFSSYLMRAGSGWMVVQTWLTDDVFTWHIDRQPTFHAAWSEFEKDLHGGDPKIFYWRQPTFINADAAANTIKFHLDMGLIITAPAGSGITRGGVNNSLRRMGDNLYQVRSPERLLCDALFPTVQEAWDVFKRISDKTLGAYPVVFAESNKN